MKKQHAHNLKVFLIWLSLLGAGYCFGDIIGVGVVLFLFALLQII